MSIHRALRDEAPERYPWWRKVGRRERPLYLFVGRRGSGKTMLLSDIGIRRMRQQEAVYTSMPGLITDWARGLRAGHVGSLLDLVELSNCSVLIDEAQKWASAREWAAMPSSVLSAWQESRKDGLSLVFTTQHESRVDVVLRQLVDEVALCTRVPYIPRRMPLFRVQWVGLEDVDQCRRTEIEGAELWWASADTRFSYRTDEHVPEVDRDALKAYLGALKNGLQHEEAVEFCGASERVEPSRFCPTTNSWVPWGDGFSLLRRNRCDHCTVCP